MTAQERAKILVVESNERTLGFFERILSQQYTVVTAQTLERGQELLLQNVFAAVLAGDSLPWLGCIDFLQQVQNAMPYACRILLGTHPQAEHVIAAINSAKIHHYVTKPWRNVAITSILEEEIRTANNLRHREEEHSALRRQTIDATHGLPIRAVVLDRLTEQLRTTGCLGVIWFSISDYHHATLSQPSPLTEQLNAFVKRIGTHLVRTGDIVALEDVGSDRLCVFLRGPRDNRVGNHYDVAQAAARLRALFDADIGHLVPASFAALEPEMGWAHTVFDPQAPPVTQVAAIVDRARRMAQSPQPPDRHAARTSELDRIIQERCIRSLYQPIVALGTNEVLGFEALSRGPAGSRFESPEYLLNAADAAGLTMEMDRIFRSMALTNAVTLPRNSKIFINTLASATHDPDLGAERLAAFLHQLDIAPQRVVLEFSERCNVSNHGVWVENLQTYRNLGLQLAIDDVGTGYSSLERIVALRPNYIKMDRTLVQGIHRIELKRSVMQAMMGLAHALDAKLVAEGVECAEDVICLRDIGVPYGQGHLFGKPAHPTPRSWSMMPAMA